jgi:hypothetical protein
MGKENSTINSSENKSPDEIEKIKLLTWLAQKKLHKLSKYIETLTQEDFNLINSAFKKIDSDEGIYRLTWVGISQEQDAIRLIKQIQSADENISKAGAREFLNMVQGQ